MMVQNNVENKIWYSKLLWVINLLEGGLITVENEEKYYVLDNRPKDILFVLENPSLLEDFSYDFSKLEPDKFSDIKYPKRGTNALSNRLRRACVSGIIKKIGGGSAPRYVVDYENLIKRIFINHHCYQYKDWQKNKKMQRVLKKHLSSKCLLINTIDESIKYMLFGYLLYSIKYKSQKYEDDD